MHDQKAMTHFHFQDIIIIEMLLVMNYRIKMKMLKINSQKDNKLYLVNCKSMFIFVLNHKMLYQ